MTIEPNGSKWSTMTSAIRVYCCAHERNTSYREELEYHFAALKRQGQILTWHNDATLPGTNRQRTSEHYFYSADLLLLLISHYFFNSEFCWNIMQQALQLHATGCAHLLPVIVSPVDYEITPIGRLLVLPRGKPLSRWPNRDEAYVDVVKGVREIMDGLPLEQLRAKRSSQDNVQQHKQSIVYKQTTLPETMNPYVYKERGDFLFDQHLYDEALAAYDIAIRLKPDFSLAYKAKGYVLNDLARLTYEQFKQLAIQSFEMPVIPLRYEQLEQLATQSFEIATLLDFPLKRKEDLG